MTSTYKSISIFNSFKEFILHFLLAVFDRFFIEANKPNNQDEKWLLVVKLDLLGDYVLVRNFIEIITKQEKYKGFKVAFCCNAGVEEISKFLDKAVIDKWIPVKLKPFVKQFKYRKQVLSSLNEVKYEVAFFPTQSRSFFHDDSVARNVNAINNVAPDGNSYNETKWQFQKAKKYYTNLLPHGFNYDFEFDLNRSFFSKALNVALEIPYPKIDLQKSKKTTVIISPGASAEFRRWSTQKFIEVIRAILITNPKQEILISGAPSEKPLGKAIKSSFANIANVKNACGTMRLSELCVELANCSLLISNESGVVHLAKAVGVPLIYCISNGNHYGRFNPYPSSDKRLVLRYFYPPSFQEAIDANKQKALEKYYWGSRISIDGIKPSVIINALRIDLNS